MRINYNASAIVSNKALNQNDKLLTRSMQRLSSGLKINSAMEDPAGLAISHRMDSQVRGFSVAGDATATGISVVDTADGALGEISEILQRLNQIAVEAGTDTTTDADRELLDKEAQQLKQEITRIARDTEFNGQPLLDGTWDLKGYVDDKSVQVDYYTASVPVGDSYGVDFSNLVNADGSVNLSALTGFDDYNISATSYKDGDITTVLIKGRGDFELQLSHNETLPLDGTTSKITITGMGAMKIQTGVNEAQELALQIPMISLRRMGMEHLSIDTFDDAQKAIASVKTGLEYVNKIRAKLGAFENRLEHNANNVAASKENMTSAYSKIMDVDMAEEMTEYTTRQVLVQAGTSMLAQTNERPQQVLQLLQ